MKKIILLTSFLAFSAFTLSGCVWIERAKSNPPACKSYKYSQFMGKSMDYVIAQNIPEKYTFIGNGEPVKERDDTRIAFYLEGNPPLVSGIGCF